MRSNRKRMFFVGVLCLFLGGLAFSQEAGAIPPPLPVLCQACKKSSECFSGNLCWGGTSGLGFCVQACGGDGSCPEGFQCQNVGPGLKQCLPTKTCFFSCAQSPLCPAGLTCESGRCIRKPGGLEGDFCDATAPCAADHWCTTFGGISRCVKRCGPKDGEAGSACSASLPCQAGLECTSLGGSDICLRPCQGTCPGKESCTTTAAKQSCVCRDKSQCAAGEFCNQGVVGYFGGCTADPFAGKPSPCSAGLSCQPIAAKGYGCLPEIGVQKSGDICSIFLPCQAGAECRQMTPDEPPQCYKTCMSPDPTDECKGLGKCDFIGRTGNYCFCSQKSDCSDGDSCNPVPGPFQHGLCSSGETSICKQKEDCPSDTICSKDKCVFPTVAEGPPTEGPVEDKPKEALPPEVRPEKAKEALKEPLPPDGSPADGSAEAAKEAGTETPDGPSVPEKAADKTGGGETSLPKGACQCDGLGSPTSLLFGLWVILFAMIGFRRR